MTRYTNYDRSHEDTKIPSCVRAAIDNTHLLKKLGDSATFIVRYRCFADETRFNSI